MDSSLLFRVKRLSPHAILPIRATNGAAGYDLTAVDDCVIAARGKAMVSTGLAIAVPHGTYGRIAPRSGLAWKYCIDVGAGVVDEDFRNCVMVILFNHSDYPVELKRGDRIAQLVLEKIETPVVVEVESLEDTRRGLGGFGSTGVQAIISKEESPKNLSNGMKQTISQMMNQSTKQSIKQSTIDKTIFPPL